MSSLNHFSLLVIDDEPDLRTLYELTLLREGYDLETAGSVDEALLRLQDRSYSAIITDMRLPDGSGLDLLRWLEKNGRREKAIVITAYGSAENAVEALKAGAYDYLTKPVDLKQFRAVIASALGRGGAGFPTGVKWSFMPKEDGKPHYLVCNADESEPGTYKDRYLMEFLPHLLIEGLIVSSFALGSHCTYIYIRGEYAWIVDILEHAIQEARDNGFLGNNILGTGFDCEIYVHRGAGAYICGEETALLESLEGKRGNPRIKPPFPAIAGLYGAATLKPTTLVLQSFPATVALILVWLAYS